MLRLDVRAAVEIGDRSGNFQHAVIAPGRHIQRAETPAASAQYTRCPTGSTPAALPAASAHCTAFGCPQIERSEFSRSIDSLFDLCRRLGRASPAQLFKLHRRHLYNDINSVKHRPDTRDRYRSTGCLRAGAPSARVAVPAALAGIHRADHHKLTPDTSWNPVPGKWSRVRPQAAGAAPRAYRGGNSGSSSRNSTPLCASETSPGRGVVPPPASAVAEAVWCGARNGLVCTSGCSGGRRPITE